MTPKLYQHRFQTEERFYWIYDVLECIFPFTKRDRDFQCWPLLPVYAEDYWGRRN